MGCIIRDPMIEMTTEVIPEHTIRWTKDGRKFYAARIVQDMLGWWAVLCEWGSLHSRLGNSRTYAFRTRTEACRWMQSVSRKREKRGYLVRCSIPQQ